MLNKIPDQRIVDTPAQNANRPDSLFKAIVEGSVDGLVVVDRAGTVLFANPAAAGILGRKAEELIGASFGFPVTADEPSELVVLGDDGTTGIVELRATETTWKGQGAYLASLRDVTETRRADEALRKNERLLRDITDNMFDLVALTDLGGSVTYVSPSHRQLGYEPEHLVGCQVHEHIHPDDLEYVLGEIAEVLRSPEPRKAEFRYRCADGTYAWLESVGKVLVDEEGWPSGLIISSRDISERKRAEQELSVSERRFRALFENSLAPIVIADDEGSYIDVNPAACAMFGYDRERFQSMKVSDLVTPTSWSAGEQYEEYKRSGASHGKFRFLRPDGEERVALWSAAEISAGEHASVLRDVTELHRYGQRLRAEKERAQRYLDVAAVMLIGLDAQGRITLLNRRGCEILGIDDASAAIGREGLEFVPPDQRDELKRVFRAILRGADGEAYQRLESRVLTTRGEQRRVVWHNAVVRDEGGDVVGTLSSGEDVTERRQMEAQLAQADRLSSMGMLAAGVAHEINNPLSYILYNLESLTEDLPLLTGAVDMCQAAKADAPKEPAAGLELGSPDPTAFDDVELRFLDALNGAHRIKEIARGLGTFSRVEEDQLLEVDLNRVIEFALNMASNEIKYRARVVKDYGDIPPVLGSEGRLSQVFLNLFINATHAIEEGDVEHNAIEVRTRQEGGQVCAQVRDTGSGIPEKTLANIFDPFFTTKGAGVGSGLGLAISRSIIEGYQGTISVRSIVGTGTCFTIRLPAADTKSLATPEPVEDEDEECASPPSRILVVDDEPGIRRAMGRILRPHQVVEAGSGEQARDILEGDPEFDLILCDMMMPRWSGVDFHEWLSRTIPALAGRVIFITGGAFTPRAREYLKRTKVSSLEKPFDPRTLKRMVRAMVHPGGSPSVISSSS